MNLRHEIAIYPNDLIGYALINENFYINKRKKGFSHMLHTPTPCR
jgi:hypothetical protein